MTNRHWYDDSNGVGREEDSKESSFASRHDFSTLTITAIKLIMNGVLFSCSKFKRSFTRPFYIWSTGAGDCAALGPFCVKSLTAVHS